MAQGMLFVVMWCLVSYDLWDHMYVVFVVEYFSCVATCCEVINMLVLSCL